MQQNVVKQLNGGLFFTSLTAFSSKFSNTSAFLTALLTAETRKKLKTKFALCFSPGSQIDSRYVVA